MADHVALLTPLHGRDGGVAAHVAESARALRDAGHEVTIVCGAAVDPLAAGVVVLPELNEPLAAAGVDALKRTLGDLRPDVVHVHEIALAPIVAASRAIAPTVVSAHGYPGCSHNNHYFAPGVECHQAHQPSCLAKMAFRGCLHARNPLPVPHLYRSTTRRLGAYRACDAVVAYSRAVAAHLEDNGLDAELVPLFTPLAGIEPAPASAGERRVLFVGRIVPAKGLDVLLDAIGSLDATLTVAGEGWSRHALEQRAERLGLASRVRFAGWLDGESLRRAYAEAAVVAIPSVWPEPFGLVGLEAMASARPVVASLTGGIGDWIEHDVTGLAVAPGDAPALAASIGALLDEPERARSMGRNGRRALEQHFSVESHVAALRRVYELARKRALPSGG